MVWQAKFPGGALSDCGSSYNTRHRLLPRGCRTRLVRSEPAFNYDGIQGMRSDGKSSGKSGQQHSAWCTAAPIAAAGHVDFVQTQDGHWWSVFLATRPYEANLSNTGRETFLLPVTWRKGWPRILPAGTPVPLLHPRPQLPAGPLVDRSRWRDAFDARRLSPDWEMIRTPAETWYCLADSPSGLALQVRAVSMSGSGNPSFIGKRQRHAVAVVETELRYTPARYGDRAGLVAFADERHHYFLGLWQTGDGAKLVVTVRNGAADPEEGRIIAAMSYSTATGQPASPNQRRRRGL